MEIRIYLRKLDYGRSDRETEFIYIFQLYLKVLKKKNQQKTKLFK